MINKELVEKRFCRYWGKDKLDVCENEYLNKYLMPDIYFQDILGNKMFSIFNNPVGFPNNIFAKDYDYKIFNGGGLFVEDEFALLKRCLGLTNDKWIFVIEEIHTIESGRLLMKFPVETNWSDLMAGGMLSYELIERPVRNYFVFGDSYLWGKYVGSDYDPPKDILGFKKHVDIFRNVFESYEVADG
jgi:hypothetical protein